MKKIKTPMLVNAVEMNHAHPETFQLPDVEEIESLTEGSLVKVSDNQERFWVEIVRRQNDVLVGRVDNHLFSRKLKYNDLIQFCTANVYQVENGS